MKISETNKKVIERISKKGTEFYINMPQFFMQFSYPVTLELSEWIGAKVYQKGFANPLEFLCLMANKFYTSINASSENILESFILNEGKAIKEKTRKLVHIVKKWEINEENDNELAEAITDFCRKTYAVRIPMASFFLRMLLPQKFGTIDFRCIVALKSLGFETKELPPENTDKDTYLKQYNGADYLQYNIIITEIGKHYQIPTKFGGTRHMTPSEVDMALYEYNKEAGKLTAQITITLKTPTDADKIQRIMDIVEEIVKGTRTGPSWVKRAGESFLRNMKKYAANNDIDAMFEYCTRLAKGGKGKGIAKWLQNRGMPSIESEYEKIKSIYQNRQP
jgi:hypothetical protein